MSVKRFVAPDTRGWPDHWQRPTHGDLTVMADGYARGAVPPHHQLLNEVALPLAVGSARCREVVDRLYEVAQAEEKAGQRGLGGLAAPQIGIPVRACLFDPRADGEGPPTVDDLDYVINPTVRALDDSYKRLPEGCVSSGQIVGWVTRADRVLLDGHLVDGQRIRREYVGRAARALLHETDHLDGVRFPEHTSQADLLWVSAERRCEFTDHVKTVLRSERVDTWPTRAPRDQWNALRNGLAVFGDLEEATTS
jgi:peptide deformylase